MISRRGFLKALGLGAAALAVVPASVVAAFAEDTSDHYSGMILQIVGPDSSIQSRVITSYDGGTCVATVNRRWPTGPRTADVYVIIPTQETEAE